MPTHSGIYTFKTAGKWNNSACGISSKIPFSTLWNCRLSMFGFIFFLPPEQRQTLHCYDERTTCFFRSHSPLSFIFVFIASVNPDLIFDAETQEELWCHRVLPCPLIDLSSLFLPVPSLSKEPWIKSMDNHQSYKGAKELPVTAVFVYTTNTITLLGFHWCGT